MSKYVDKKQIDKCKKYAWYSKKQEEVTKTIVYYTDVENNIVAATCINNSSENAGSKFDDIYCVGEVCKFVNRVCLK
tara:strand:- start:4686 stop:4916 length:231 start_codon:yes stop_codon:yes gene_type:complete